MRISTFFYTLRQGIINIFRNKWFSLASVATIGACLFLFGLFYSVIVNFQNIVRTAQEGVCVTVLFDEGISGETIEEIGALIDRRAETSRVVFKSADEAWEEFKVDYLKGYADGFPDNPLTGSDSYEVYLSDVSMQPALVSYLEGLDGIREVNRSELAGGLYFRGDYRDFVCGIDFPYKQYGNHRNFCQERRNCHYEIYRGNGLFRALPVRD